jgi:hypothetical protein
MEGRQQLLIVFYKITKMDLKRDDDKKNGGGHHHNYQTDQQLADAFDENYLQDDQNDNPEANSDRDGSHRDEPSKRDAESRPRRGDDSGDDRSDRRRSRSRDGRRGYSRERRDYKDPRDVNPDTFTQIHVSKLDRRTGQSDIEDCFRVFGRIRTVTMKTHYAFVDFEDHASAV